MTAAARVRYPRLRSPIRLGPLPLRHRAGLSGHGLPAADPAVTGITATTPFSAFGDATAPRGCWAATSDGRLPARPL